MSEPASATEATKTALEDSVHWLLADKLSAANMPVTTNKYMTANNLLVYLTLCSLPDATAPRLKVQVFQRVNGGVHETGYHLYADHRFEKYENDMIFGQQPPAGADGSVMATVSEEEAQLLLQLTGSLTSARQTL